MRGGSSDPHPIAMYTAKTLRAGGPPMVVGGLYENTRQDGVVCRIGGGGRARKGADILKGARPAGHVPAVLMTIAAACSEAQEVVTRPDALDVALVVKNLYKSAPKDLFGELVFEIGN